MDVDKGLDSARAEGLVGTGVDVAMNLVVRNDIGASTLVLTAAADDNMLLLNTCEDRVGVATLVIREVVDDVNAFGVAALAAEDDMLKLNAAAEADVEVLMPPAVPENAVPATIAGPGVQVFTALAVPDADRGELLDPDRAEVLGDSDGVGVDALATLEVADNVNISVTEALVADDDVLLLEAVAEADGEVPVPPAAFGNALSTTVERSGVQVSITLAVLDADRDEPLDPARTEVLVVSSGVGRAELVILELVDNANAPMGATPVADDGILLPEATAEADMVVLVPPAVLGNAASATIEGPDVPALAALAGLDADKDELLDPVGSNVLSGPVADLARNHVASNEVDFNALMLSAGADEGVRRLRVGVNRVGVTALAGMVAILPKPDLKPLPLPDQAVTLHSTSKDSETLNNHTATVAKDGRDMAASVKSCIDGDSELDSETPSPTAGLGLETMVRVEKQGSRDKPTQPPPSSEGGGTQ